LKRGLTGNSLSERWEESMSGKGPSKDEATMMLRTVTPDKAFYFYAGIGQPLGSSSKSLVEFAQMVKEVDLSSVKFHLERGDFEIRFRMLGDQSLARQIGSLRGKNVSADELRAQVSSNVGTRVSQLQRASRLR
jgi:hypothetical protein